MEERLRQKQERGGGRVTEAKPAPDAQKTGQGVWWMIGLYILFHFIFSSSAQ